MNSNIAGILVGGIVPALLFGGGGILQKAAQRAGISMGWYILLISVGVLSAGLVLFVTEPVKQVSIKGGVASFFTGFSWALGMICVATAITKFGMPVSKLAPLYNMNTLIAVLLGLLIYAEWKELNVATLLIGAAFIVVGGILVSRS